jgi:hypothetical protein
MAKRLIPVETACPQVRSLGRSGIGGVFPLRWMLARGQRRFDEFQRTSVLQRSVLSARASGAWWRAAVLFQAVLMGPPRQVRTAVRTGSGFRARCGRMMPMHGMACLHENLGEFEKIIAAVGGYS